MAKAGRISLLSRVPRKAPLEPVSKFSLSLRVRP